MNKKVDKYMTIISISMFLWTSDEFYTTKEHYFERNKRRLCGKRRICCLNNTARC